jgi:hypothetical protein
MKRPISWHVDCLRNLHASWERAKEAEIRAKMESLRLAGEMSFRQRQINEARRLGKEEFDGERFMAKDRPNPSDETLREVAGG